MEIRVRFDRKSRKFWFENMTTGNNSELFTQKQMMKQLEIFKQLGITI